MGVSEGLLQGREKGGLQLWPAPPHRLQRSHHAGHQLAPLRPHQLRRHSAQHGRQAHQQRLAAPLLAAPLQPLHGGSVERLC